MKNNVLSILLATTFLSTPAIAVTLEPTLENSAISYSVGNSSDYNFTIQEADAEGNLTTKYYKIDINKDKISTSSNISWLEVDETKKDESNVVEVQLPNNQSKYFQYTYTTPSGYETITESENISVVNPTDTYTYKYVGAAINNASGNDYGDISEKIFLNNKVIATLKNTNSYRYLHVNGGTISNQGTIGSIVADFIGNSIEIIKGESWYAEGAIYAYGGAIYNNNTIGYILGNFIGNYVIGSTTGSNKAYGGAISNDNEVGYITGDFIGNYVSVYSYNSAYGGAIYNTGSIGNITGNFIGNYASISYDSFASGGAIYNNGSIGNITGDFIGNHISGTDRNSSYGGAISSTGNIGNITGDFISNYASTTGGAIDNGGTIGDIDGDFIGNYTEQSRYTAKGGAIYNVVSSLKDVTIGDIGGDFIGNYASSSYTVFGGAICNYADYLSGNDVGTTTIGNITGDFINNYALSASGGGSGGAIYNGEYGFIGDITGDFISNYIFVVDRYGYGYGGAIDNTASIGNITGNFIGNYIESIDTAYGGAIDNTGEIGNINVDFIGNHIEAKEIAYGGAIATLGSFSFEGLEFNQGYISGSFIDNYAKVTEEGGKAFGGAIALQMAGDLTFLADNRTNVFSGNYVEDADGNTTNNAIGVLYVADVEGISIPVPALNFEIKNNGSFIFDDEIDGMSMDMNTGEMATGSGAYNINLYGDAYNTSTMDETNTIRFNDLVNNVYDFSIDSVQMALGKNAVVNIVHNYVAKNNPYLRLDLDAVNREVGQINIEGDVDGTTNVIVNVLQNKKTAKEESIVFATAKNDTLGGEDSFTVSRVIGSPYMWKVNYDTTEKQWGLYSTEEQNPDEEDDPVVPTPDTPDTPSQPLGPIEVAPEVIATVAVKTAGLSQTNGMVYNIMRKVGVNRLFCPGCGFYDYNWDGEAFHNVWVDTTYNGLTIEAPVEIEAKVWGIDAGSDLQHDLNNKLGIFVSYRQGNYEMDGKGEKYYSKVGSELDIDSYLAGLYYRYDRNNWYAFATVYGGMQNAEIQTDDGAANYDTDGIEFGGSIEAGYNYALTRKLSVTPSLGAFYSQISYDDATDNVGKTVNYNDLKQIELEAGAKFAYTQYTDNGFYSLYVKPSVVQTLVDGDEINITEIGKVDTVEDKTLGRVELGGNYGFNDNWSAYGWANYTFGSDYEATSLGFGLNYAW